MGEVFTLQEVADRLRIPYRTVRDAVFSGRWPHLMMSPRKRMMTTEDVDAVIALLHQDAAEPASMMEARAAKQNVRNLLAA